MVAPWTALEDVTAESGANNDGSLSNDRPNLKFNPEFNPNALVGKATCIQLKPAGRIVCFDWQYCQIWQDKTSRCNDYRISDLLKPVYPPLNVRGHS